MCIFVHCAHLKSIQEKENPSKDSCIGTDSEETDHPGESKKREKNNKSLQQSTAVGDKEIREPLLN